MVKSLIWHIHRSSLKFFYITSLIACEGPGFLGSCGKSNSHLKGLCLQSSGDLQAFMLQCLIRAHMPNSFNMFSSFIKQIFVMSKRFPAGSSCNFFSPSRRSLPLVNSLPGVFCILFKMLPLALSGRWRCAWPPWESGTRSPVVESCAVPGL